MTPYLIQRAKFLKRTEKKGIDSILIFSYMGSAEFEWGALPDSLEIIRKLKNTYKTFDTVVGGKMITVHCTNTQEKELRPYLTELSEGKHYLKEYADFDNYINDKKCNTDFWWDIKNHFMFWIKNEDFEKEFKDKIK